MNELFLRLGVENLKPVATALLLPPVPSILLALLGLGLLRRRRWVGAGMVVASSMLVWLSCCTGAANAIAPVLLRLPSALTAAQLSEMARHSTEPVAIIVLGSGVETFAPEYGTSNLPYRSLERLRYGIWLGRRIGWPTAFSGGVGWGQPADGAIVSEAVTAQRIATEEFSCPLRWVESTSRDTRENALNTIAMLRGDGIKHILLVTHFWHMPRAIRNFKRADHTGSIRIEAAPMGLAVGNEWPWMRWMPSGAGLDQTRVVVHEWLGMLGGA